MVLWSQTRQRLAARRCVYSARACFGKTHLSWPACTHRQRRDLLWDRRPGRHAPKLGATVVTACTSTVCPRNRTVTSGVCAGGASNPREHTRAAFRVNAEQNAACARQPTRSRADRAKALAGLCRQCHICDSARSVMRHAQVQAHAPVPWLASQSLSLPEQASDFRRESGQGEQRKGGVGKSRRARRRRAQSK